MSSILFSQNGCYLGDMSCCPLNCTSDEAEISLFLARSYNANVVAAFNSHMHLYIAKLPLFISSLNVAVFKQLE
jgi:hypothetical protein